MCRALTLLVVMGLTALTSAQAPMRPQTGDPVVRVLSDLESALVSPTEDLLRALISPTIAPLDRATIINMRAGSGPMAAIIRERDRLPSGAGVVVLAELLVSHGLDGRLATWEISMRPSARSAERWEISRIRQLANVEGLVKLALDRSRQFSVHNLVLSAPDMTVRMSSGSAFLAQGPSGQTALVLRGRGVLKFAPSDAAEQGQIRLLTGQPLLEQNVDSVFVRMNPAFFTSYVSAEALTQTAVEPLELARAQEVFDQLAPRTFNLGLSSLTSERWTLLPNGASLAVELKTRRFGWLTYTRSPGDAEDITLFDRARSRNISVYASTQRLATRGRFYSEDDELSYDVLHYGMDVSFDPSRAWVAGRGSLQVRIKSPSTQTLLFRLAESLSVSSITSPQLGRLLAVRVVGQTGVIVSLPEMVSEGRELTFNFTYSGRLEPQELSQEAVQLISGNPPSAPDLIRPEARFMYSNHVYWYPQNMVTDFATASLRLSVPSEYQVIASGNLIGSAVSAIDDQAGPPRGDVKHVRTAEYFSNHPVRYLSCVITRLAPVGRAVIAVPAVAPAEYDPSPDPSGEVFLEVTATPRIAGRNRTLTSVAGEVLRFYAQRFGDAPYPNLTVAAADALMPGGHAPAFFAVIQQPLPMTPLSWGADPLAFDRFPNYLISHEIAHQWWGQAIGFKSYHDQWLSEGLAQYSASLFLGAGRPEVERAFLKQMRDSAMSYNSRGPIFLGYRLGHVEGRGAVFRAIAYNKAATVLHMLRGVLGEAGFDAGLQRFYRTWRFRKAGTDDFRQALEAETGRPLGRFFDRWVMGSSLPKLRMSSRVDGSTATVRVDQIGEIFDLPVTATIEYTDGRSEDVQIVLSDAVTELRVPLKGTIKRIGPREELTLANWVN